MVLCMYASILSLSLRMSDKEIRIKVIGPTPGPDDVWYVHVERLEGNELIYNAAIPVHQAQSESSRERATKVAQDLRKVLKAII